MMHLVWGLVFVLAACGVRPTLTPYAGDVARIQQVLVATTRAPGDGTLKPYGGKRSDDIDFARYGISIPPDRKPGEIRLPRRDPDPSREFLTAERERFGDEADFVAALNASVADLPRGERQVTVFVHGFNVSYPAAVLRAAQMAHDFEVPGPMVLFSWPSAGRLTHYVYDRDSTLVARDRFIEVLRMIARSDADSIVVLAHSMGAFLTMESLRTLEAVEDHQVIDRLAGVVLAEPDIDVDVFKMQVRRVDLDHTPIAIIGSQKDYALRLSQFVAGQHPRVGENESIEEMRRLGVLVIDVTGAQDQSVTGHTAFATNPQLLELFSSGQLAQRIIHGNVGEDILVGGLQAAGNVALAIAYLPYQLTN
ncbi:alpha/beta hydrolase [Pseudooceanicola aestuarii]|uniref:alpha/beta hydrolase n=1 Tax=Pseudooceanicola aestuarii TaxID=2697319 RepID=UPI0013D2EDB2|nr:alpha/beta fold hydrolase [Pseudooceanicola aestuarii]